MNDLNTPHLNSMSRRRAAKEAAKAADLAREFARQDMVADIWGRPYDGPVANTKRRELRK